MPDISLNLGPNIDQHDLNALRDNIKSLNPGDKVTVRIEATDANEAGKVTDELVRQGFDYQPHGGHGRDFYFTAFKKSE